MDVTTIGHQQLYAQLPAASGEDFARLLYPLAFQTARLVVRDPALAQDAAQDALVILWRHRAKIPAGPAARSYVSRAIVNAATSRLRSELVQGRGASSLDAPAASGQTPAAQLAETGPGPGDLAEARACAFDVAGALAELPEPLRIVLVLRFWTGLSERETAAVIERRPGTVKSRLHEAKRLLALDPRLQSWAGSQPPTLHAPFIPPRPEARSGQEATS